MSSDQEAELGLRLRKWNSLQRHDACHFGKNQINFFLCTITWIR